MRDKRLLLAALLFLLACANPGVRITPPVDDGGLDAGLDGGPDAGLCGPMPAMAPYSDREQRCDVLCPSDPHGCVGHSGSSQGCYDACGYGGCCACTRDHWNFVFIGDCWPQDGGYPLGSDAGIDAGPCGPMPDAVVLGTPPNTFNAHCAVECPADPDGCLGDAESNPTCYAICGWGGCCQCESTEWQFRSVTDCFKDGGS